MPVMHPTEYACCLYALVMNVGQGAWLATAIGNFEYV